MLMLLSPIRCLTMCPRLACRPSACRCGRSRSPRRGRAAASLMGRMPRCWPSGCSCPRRPSRWADPAAAQCYSGLSCCLDRCCGSAQPLLGRCSAAAQPLLSRCSAAALTCSCASPAPAHPAASSLAGLQVAATFQTPLGRSVHAFFFDPRQSGPALSVADLFLPRWVGAIRLPG